MLGAEKTEIKELKPGKQLHKIKVSTAIEVCVGCNGSPEERVRELFWNM